MLRDDMATATVDEAARPHSIARSTAAPATAAQYTESAAVAVGLWGAGCARASDTDVTRCASGDGGMRSASP